ncbi:MAG: DUF11 domain-containing protein [Chloroflexi bacterium]|nr:DUF11 domain-containing protein [Chloroflexota bacterium]MBU1748224.1 DUF11 domain-containing protein [Chloroflexota bacterium]
MSTSSVTYSSVDFSYNTTYLVVVKYNATTGNSALYVLDAYSATEPGTPLLTSDPGTTIPFAVLAVAIRQGSGGPTGVIDGIRVATNWADAVGSAAAFAIAKSASSAMIGTGEVLTYTIQVQNTGVAGEATGVVITDAVPAGTTWAWGGSYADGVVSFTTPSTISMGSAVNVAFGVTINAAFGSSVVNDDYGVYCTEVPTPTMGAPVTVTVSALDLVVGKTGPNCVIAGEDLVYAITLDSQGVTTATNVILTDTLPISTTYDSDDSGVVPTNPSPGVYVWSLGDVPSNTLKTINLTVTVDSAVASGTLLTNEAEASTDTVGDNPANNKATWDTTAYQLSTIAEARAGTNGQVFALEGRVTVAPGSYSASEWEFQDATGGISVYYFPPPTVALGDQVRLIATRSSFNNQEQMATPVCLFVNQGSGPEVDPKPYNTGDVNTGDTEGWLVVVTGTVSGLGGCTGNYSFFLDDGSGPALIFVDQDTGANVCAMGIEDGDLVRVVGFSTQYQTTYEIKPRRPADFQEFYPVTFVYHDVEDVVHTGEDVYVAGSFNSWDANANALTPNGDYSVFSTTITLNITGTYDYKYIVKSGGDQWDWLNTANRSIDVQDNMTVNDYRKVAVGYAHLMAPPAITINLGEATDIITGEVFIQNVTNPAGVGRAVWAELGYGTTADPSLWTWVAMSYTGLQNGNNDIYSGNFTPMATGVYSYAVRFDGNQGAGNPNAGWEYGDLDGVWPGNPFNVGQAGVLTVQAPDLSGSAKMVTPTTGVKPGDMVTYTIRLVNASGTAVIAANVMLTDTLPAEVTVVIGTLPAGMTYHAGTHTLTWSGTVAPGETKDLVFQVHVLGLDVLLPGVHTFHNTVDIDDGYAILARQSADTTVTIYRQFLPLTFRN